jgi:hypothetical protein
MSRNSTRWYRRFAEIPNVGYAGDDALRAKLPDRDAKPTISRFDVGGERVASLSWKTSFGEGSASPVHHLAFGVDQNERSDEVRKRVLKALELPGEPSDYHFAIQHAADVLWKRRRDEPEHLEFVEWLSWLDVRLVEAHSDAFKIGQGSQGFLQINALQRLVDLYEREGFLREALEAAKRVARFQVRDRVAELEERVRRLDEEHG